MIGFLGKENRLRQTTTGRRSGQARKIKRVNNRIEEDRHKDMPKKKGRRSKEEAEIDRFNERTNCGNAASNEHKVTEDETLRTKSNKHEMKAVNGQVGHGMIMRKCAK